MFKAHEIPIESQVPLFDKIMEDQERKNFLVREKRKAELQSQMRPFSFTKRDEELQELTKKFSRSFPNLDCFETPLKVKKFKAKPIPKNLFSNYIYKKMHEDEFYRALQKKIRAEEMLRAASLPPSMAKREKTKERFDVCPRNFKVFQNHINEAKKKNKNKVCKSQKELMEKDLEELKRDLLDSPCTSYKRLVKKRNSSARSKSSSGTSSTFNLHSINRSNLAAVLRIESSKKKLEDEICQKLEEARIKEEARWKEKIMRKRPVWQALAYSHEEDLAMRLQMRKEEERLRKEEHQLRMQLMLGRVNQQPTLFERQSMVKCPKTREELVEQLHREYSAGIKPRRSLSDLSDMKSSETKEVSQDDNYDKPSLESQN